MATSRAHYYAKRGGLQASWLICGSMHRPRPTSGDRPPLCARRALRPVASRTIRQLPTPARSVPAPWPSAGCANERLGGL